MKREQASIRMRVAYVPRHAQGNLSHPDVEQGAISYVGEEYVFVRFDKEVEHLGWDNTRGKACDPRDLVIL